ncbi:MAG: phosphoenolpyruvate--protein phosphotransferase [Gemmatimonadetes bacterium]|jgi:phosphotransferase system enzyme I (PtsI)|nr:phosphoenolpyruvate--protein phosphotransferase [Gemmatimonadota bacterium]MBK8062286.1 phosphoenolpyruvate--protein phosphotransferase [Gemmatimonadota bacterium]MCC7324713.1 phosphoenolpyruvate--protein phosphotransferase [Gemmatimonadaceae bacterium]
MDRAIVGISASPGIVLGPVHLLRWEVPDVPHHIIPDEDVDREIARFHDAIEKAKVRLRGVRDRAERHAGPEEAAIFEVQITILEDQELAQRVESYIRQNLGAEKAFDLVLLEWRQHFAKATSAMMRERVGDLTDVHIRVLSVLLGLPDHDPVDVPKGTNAILVTHDLTPSLTVQLDREAIAGIATESGTRTSHVAILARSLGLPAVVGLRDAVTRLRGDEYVVLDGSSGILIVNPSAAEIDTFRNRAVAEAQTEAELLKGAEGDAITTDGVRITIRANVDLPDEAEQAAHSGAEGVGLMRTEFLVVGRAAMPDEEEQYRAYTRVVEAFGGRAVVIRTFDVGGDKLPIGGFPAEANPFLGWRAIRMCLDEPELFKVQLRALLRAALHGDVRIMLPLIVSLDEIREARRLLDESAEELERRGVPFKRAVPLGIMIETPAAVIGADAFVDDVAFFSIGTNDLVQYTLAVDRGNANLASRFTPLHPSVLRLVKRTVEVGAAHGLDVSVCGEMASQPLMAFALIGLGLRTLSVNPRAVPLVKRIVRGLSVSFAAEAATAAMQARTAAEAERQLKYRLLAAFGDAAFLRDNVLQ